MCNVSTLSLFFFVCFILGHTLSSGLEDLEVSCSTVHSEHSAGLTRNQQEYRYNKSNNRRIPYLLFSSFPSLCLSFILCPSFFASFISSLCLCLFLPSFSCVFFHSILPVSLSASSLSCHSFLLEIIHFILPRVLPPFLHSFQLQFYSYAILTHFHPGNVSHRSIMHFIFCIFWNKIEGLELQFKYLAWRSILFKWRQNIFGELVNLRVLSSQK